MISAEEGIALIKSLAPVSRETEQRLITYHDQLTRWQARINLISPNTLHESWRRHFADSAQCYFLKPEARHWIDIGSGAGFPGLVSAILLAERGGGRVDLVESNGKKCAFLAEVARKCDLIDAGLDIRIHQERVERILPKLDRPDVITARALAPLERLMVMTEEHLCNGAIGLFQKGRDHGEEIRLASRNWDFEYQHHKSLFEVDSVITEIELRGRKN